MPIISVPDQFNEDELYVDLRSIFEPSAVPEMRGFQLRRFDQAEGGEEMVRPPSGTASCGRGRFCGVLVGEPGRGAEHARGEQGLPVPVRHRLPLQPGDPAADGGVGQPGAHHRRAGSRSAASSARGSTSSARCAPPTTGTCGSTSTPTRATGWRTTARPRRRSPASSRTSTCCSSVRARPAP